MAVPDYIKRRFGGMVPAYIRRHFERRAQMRRESEEAIREAKAKKEREREARDALRRPPARVWRIGQTILWEAPETADQFEPIGYWIGENGSWHGDYVPADVRESQLYGTGPANVQAVYRIWGTSRGPPASCSIMTKTNTGSSLEPSATT